MQNTAWVFGTTAHLNHLADPGDGRTALLTALCGVLGATFDSQTLDAYPEMAVPPIGGASQLALFH